MPKKRAHGEGGLIQVAGSPYFYALFYDADGVKHRESTKETVKQKALAYLQRRMGEVHAGTLTPRSARKLTYEMIRDSLLTQYKTEGRHSLITTAEGEQTVSGLKHLDAFFKGRRAVNINTDMIRKFQAERQEDGAENGTINRNLALLRRMMFLAREEGKLANVPYFPMLEESEARQGFVEQAEFDKLLNALPEKYRPYVLFLYTTGARAGEAKKIDWSQVDLNACVVRLSGKQTKNASPRTLPLCDPLVEYFKANPGTGKLFNVGQFRKAWMSACVKAGLGSFGDPKRKFDSYSGLIVHDLRRSAVRNMVRAGIPENVAMKISGHKTRAIFDRYDIVNESERVEAIKRVTWNGTKLVQIQPDSRKQLAVNN